MSEQIADAYKEKREIEIKLSSLQKQYQDTWDYEKIRAVVAQEIMKASIARRAERKAEREKTKTTENRKHGKTKSRKYIVYWQGLFQPFT